MTPRVLIIILCYNGIALTLDCLASLRRLSYQQVDVLVVDNDSRDGTAATVRARFPEVRVIETGANLGFAAGNNVGLRYALEHGYEWAMLLNNDTEVAPDMLERLLAASDDPTIGVVGSTIYYYDRPNVIWSAGGGIDWRRGRSFMHGLDTIDDGQAGDAAPRAVAFVTGCALLVRCAAIEQAGLIDERFGMYYEETEWCVRLTRAGWRCIVVPQARVWHKIRPAQQAISPQIIYYMTRNRLLFLRLTGAPVRAWIDALLLQDGRTWWSWRLRRRWRGYAVQRAALSRGWRDFARRRFGMVVWE